uniref:Uncharacterized protein n=1 Tax=Anguilla anguilla TaxID=7936 RepID=A0A0E9SH07_ANGAN
MLLHWGHFKNCTGKVAAETQPQCRKDKRRTYFPSSKGKNTPSVKIKMQITERQNASQCTLKH